MVDPVARFHVVARIGLAGSDPHVAHVLGSDRDRADRCHGLAIEGRKPRGAAIGRLENAAPGTAGVVDVRIPIAARDGAGAAAADRRPNLAVLQADKTRRRRIGGRRLRSEPNDRATENQASQHHVISTLRKAIWFGSVRLTVRTAMRRISRRADPRSSRVIAPPIRSHTFPALSPRRRSVRTPRLPGGAAFRSRAHAPKTFAPHRFRYRAPSSAGPTNIQMWPPRFARLRTARRRCRRPTPHPPRSRSSADAYRSRRR